MANPMNTLNVSVAPNGVATVAMARPEVFNAFNEAMIDDLAQAFDTLSGDSRVRVIVLQGEGKAFSAGADVQWMQRASVATQEANVEDARRFAAMLSRIAHCPKPTVACVHGVALGGGVGLIAACDFAIASDDAKLAVSEVRLGILPSVIGPYLVNAVGRRTALRLALTASRIGADEALRIGLVHTVCARSELQAQVQALVDELLLNGPQAQAEVKALFATLQVGSVDDSVRERTAQTIARVRMGAEAKEGFDAFLNKRPAAWVTAASKA